MAIRVLPPPCPDMAVDPVRVGVPLALLLATQPIDVLTTALILRGGDGHEGNPLTLFLLHAGGYPFLLAVKLALVSAIAAKAVLLSRHSVPRARSYLTIGAVMYTLIVSWNAITLLRQMTG